MRLYSSVCACGKWVCTSDICPTNTKYETKVNQLYEHTKHEFGGNGDEEEEEGEQGENPEDDPDVKNIPWFWKISHQISKIIYISRSL